MHGAKVKTYTHITLRSHFAVTLYWAAATTATHTNLRNPTDESVGPQHRIQMQAYISREPGSSVGIATGYGLDGPGIESRWGARFSAPVQTGPGANSASCTMDTGFSPGVKSDRGVTLTPYPLLVPRSWKSRAIPLLPPIGRTACTEPQCLYKRALYLYLHILLMFCCRDAGSYGLCQWSLLKGKVHPRTGHECPEGE